MATSKYLTKSFSLSTEYINNFFSKVEIDHANDCWIWKGYKDKRGYGYVRFNGDIAFCHRLMYAWLIHPLQDGGRKKTTPVLDHICKTPSCCNPFHLRLIPHRIHMIESDGTIGFVNSRKVYCPNGHILPNKIIGKPRRCSICDRIRKHREYIANRDIIIARSREWKRLHRKIASVLF